MAAYQMRQMSAREQQIVDESLREFNQLNTWRVTFAAQWEEAAQLILPTSRNTFVYGDFNWQGQKKTDRQIDASGMVALARFSAICDSLLTPKNMKWHGLSADDEYVMKDRPTRLWFEQVTNLLFKYRYQPIANFTSQNLMNYQQLGAFGNLGMFIDEFDNTNYQGLRGIRYKAIPMGELFFKENHQGVVDGICRWFKLTARQAWQKWGEMGTFPENLRPALMQGSEYPYNFLHRICPRDDYDPDRLDDKGKPFASYYISMEGRTLLSEGGYRMLPVAVGRFEQTPGEVYGRGPAQQVLPALKTLNAEKGTFLKQGHRAADPVLLTSDDGVVDMSLRPGAVNKGGWSSDGKPLVGVLPTGNIQVTKEMMDEERALINDTFFVSLFQLALNLKDLPQMTATQVIEIMNQKSILIAPTIGNQESQYIGPMIERELDVLASQGLLPPMPPRLREAKGAYKVQFASPLARSIRSGEASGFMRTVEISKEIVSITGDHSYLDWAAFDRAMPDIAEIQSVPESWTATDDEIATKRKIRAQMQERQQEVQEAPAKAAVMKAQAAIQKAGQSVPPGQSPAAGGQPLQEQVAA